ncbi:MAG: helix-hairpin-helix domain-containing protein [Eubacteriales bacterium]|nr:helix-hairpin-helix domain-containing protein [Eubacteriales bacterium]
MKKPAVQLLVAVTCVFAAFTLGLLLGRSGSRGGVHLAVPAAMQTAPAETEPLPSATQPLVRFPIDLNSAGLDELMALPGIGEVLARRILAYRAEQGEFSTVEELLNVEDIGKKRLEQIMELVKIGG